MANRRIEEQLARLSALREAPAAEAATGLRQGLAAKVGLVVAKAAKVAGERQMHELIDDLLHAFDRLLENPVERDPQCWGKNAIAQALTGLDYRESAPYLRGARHVQMEPVWGGQEDTAANLRGICLLGLASCSDIRRETILRCLVDGLAEPKATVRVEAARALAQMGGDDSALLLRLKARTGDAEIQVVGQVFDSLLSLEREEAIPFVAEFLDKGDADTRCEAALALGGSRLAGAVEVLEASWKTARDLEFRQALLRALSASRLPQAIDFLLGVLREGRQRDAAAAREALSLHKDTPEIWKRVEEADPT